MSTAGNLKPESKRDEFKRYLEKSGVMDSLTRVLVSLYEEADRPANAIEYFLEKLANGNPAKKELESLQEEMNEMKKKIAQLEEENEGLKKKLESFEQEQAQAAEAQTQGEETGGVSGSEAVEE